MQGFQDFLVEDKNTHLEHLEDEIINNGTKGARTAINFLKSVKQMLQGGKGGSTVTVKICEVINPPLSSTVTVKFSVPL